MKPYTQTEEAFTKTAAKLKPSGNQMFSAAIQQTPTRVKINQAVVEANQFLLGAFTSGIF